MTPGIDMQISISELIRTKKTPAYNNLESKLCTEKKKAHNGFKIQ